MSLLLGFKVKSTRPIIKFTMAQHKDSEAKGTPRIAHQTEELLDELSDIKQPEFTPVAFPYPKE